MDIKMTNLEDPDASLDAVFLSPHKFIGAAGGTPGVLVAKRCLFTNKVPTLAGGGTVRYRGRETRFPSNLYCKYMR